MERTNQLPAAASRYFPRHLQRFRRGRHSAAHRRTGLYAAAAVLAAAAIGLSFVSSSPAGRPDGVAQTATPPQHGTAQTALVKNPSSGTDPPPGDQPSRQPVAPPDTQAPGPAPSRQRAVQEPKMSAASPKRTAGPATPNGTSAPPAPASSPPTVVSPSGGPIPSGTTAPSPSLMPSAS